MKFPALLPAAVFFVPLILAIPIAHDPQNNVLLIPRSAFPDANPIPMDAIKSAAKKTAKGVKKAGAAVVKAPVKVVKAAGDKAEEWKEKAQVFPHDMGFPIPGQDDD